MSMTNRHASSDQPAACNASCTPRFSSRCSNTLTISAVDRSLCYLSIQNYNLEMSSGLLGGSFLKNTLRGSALVLQRPSQSPSQSAIFLSELRVVLPLIVLPLKTPTSQLPSERRRASHICYSSGGGSAVGNTKAQSLGSA